MDFKKDVNAASLPIIVSVILGLAMGVIGTFVSPLAWLIGILIFLLNLLFYAWAGWRAAKDGEDMVGSAAAGFIAGAIASFIRGGISLALALVGVRLDSGIVAREVVSMVDAAFGRSLVSSFIAVFVGMIVSAIFGVIVGAVGGLAAGGKKATIDATATQDKKVGQ